MSRQIYDRQGNTLGFIQDDGSGQVAYSSGGHTLGHYKSAEDVTYDSFGRFVGTGNHLTGLIYEDAHG